jgi:hypothetical protein
VIDAVAEDADILVGLTGLLVQLRRRRLAPGLDAHDAGLGERETGGAGVM